MALFLLVFMVFFTPHAVILAVRYAHNLAALKAMIAAMQAGTTRIDAEIRAISATLRAHAARVQALQIQIVRLKMQKFGARPERTLRETEPRQPAPEHPEIAGPAGISGIARDDAAERSAEQSAAPKRRAAASPWSRHARRANLSYRTPVISARCWTPVLDPGAGPR